MAPVICIHCTLIVNLNYLVCALPFFTGNTTFKEENAISFEHHIFSEIHKIKPTYYRIHAIPNLVLPLSQCAQFGR